ncbi:MAG: BCCT family transporter [Dehalococcoidales bacterium]|jgi:choline/glycine/proline betaine transport protein|nr:BCCT family transporter [Dehalococcoidales bacterium]MDD3264906.1 BCCT family transporter [Dehalococcoidales bacterium]MDD4322727.1 BCCT family transporter [Dehalococcoidales bacterium]MDD4794175.1 BCCT family transporter [Dehalococcoidales bacterium]MDD5122192.1 BCCT family transporter [Dehalococcoidales bacterium]
MEEEKDRRSLSKEVLAEKLKKAEAEARQEAVRQASLCKQLEFMPSISLCDDSYKEEPGKYNWTRFGFDFQPFVSIVFLVLLITFISLTLLFPGQAESIFNKILDLITVNAGWFLILLATIFVVAILYFGLTKLGHVRLGGANAKPEFSNWGWYAMLLSAGMGIGLLFWSVAEPVTHFYAPSPMFGNIEPGSAEAARAAMVTTFFHWGVHGWAIYALVGLGLAFFAFNKGLPLTLRSIFYPVIGNRIYGMWGHTIDVLSVLATMMGLATSLGFGVTQVNAGLNYLFGISINTTTQVILIAVITGIATISVMLGLDKGVKRLSQINMIIAGVLVLLVLFMGPTIYILSGFTMSTGHYIAKLAEMSLWTEVMLDSNWQGAWTIFYWAWWISWSPFVGMFIARISKGRTVREFVMGVIIFPTLISSLWMSVFGFAGIFQESNGIADIISAVQIDESLALFAMLENLPASGLLAVIGIFLIIVFFITSSDSGSLVVNHLTSGGKLKSPVRQKVFWAGMEGLVAATLLIGGGLVALKTAAITTALPFSLVLLVMVYSLHRGLKNEYQIEEMVRDKLREVEEKHFLDEAISDASKGNRV